ncbi:lysoplasmalogenase family protein [Sphingorhabdus sp.]|uniref:lysoplasmalogenase family protein n=1 Tax=Sphingorhabdus sp. TaxID=1902408 RepID=UPI00391B72B5
MAQDLAHKRPYLLASLLAGISFPATWLFLPLDGGLFAMIWKMAAVGFLVPFALRRHHEGEFVLLAIMLAFYALGDGLIELSMVAGALAFAAGHLVAIVVYFRHRRVGAVVSQKLLAVTILLATPVIAYFLPPTRDEGVQVAAYSVILAAMAAMAWSSNFPRYRVGFGAILFVVSDLLIFAQLGPLADSAVTGIAIWYLYYFGVLMIAVGIAQTLVKRGHFPLGEERD